MTLDEAIRHELWCARESQGETAEDHMQMAEWLCELRRLRENGENARLRELVADMATCDSHAYIDGHDCDECPLYGTRRCQIDTRIEELGI